MEHRPTREMNEKTRLVDSSSIINLEGSYLPENTFFARLKNLYHPWSLAT